MDGRDLDGGMGGFEDREVERCENGDGGYGEEG